LLYNVRHFYKTLPAVYKVFKRLKELRLEKKAKTKELNCLYALTDYIDCESLADTCEDNLVDPYEFLLILSYLSW